jgi:methyltransferase (TIGR00027 family)
VKAGQASRTAEYVALFRAIESSLPADRRLFDDPFARRFLRPKLAMLAGLCQVPGVADLVASFVDSRWAGARSSAVARTRLIDDTIGRALERGIEQFVILGAGFDARAYRIGALSDFPVFEVDHPDTLARKRRLLRGVSAEAASHVRFVSIDFRSSRLDQVMTAAGYSPSLRTFILWEGVTNYLNEDAVDATLRWCASAAPGSQVVFTYVHRAVLADPNSFAGTERLFETLKAAGERWTFGLDPAELAQFLDERGLLLEEDIGSADYRARYMPRISRGMRGYEFYRLARACVPGRATQEPTG